MQMHITTDYASFRVTRVTPVHREIEYFVAESGSGANDSSR